MVSKRWPLAFGIWGGWIYPLGTVTRAHSTFRGWMERLLGLMALDIVIKNETKTGTEATPLSRKSILGGVGSLAGGKTKALT